MRVVLGKKRVKKVISDSLIKHGSMYGKLKVNKTSMKSSGGRRYYKAVCNCGETLHLTSSELLTRKRLDSGCMGFYCDQSPPEQLVWHNPEYALSAQISQALARYPQNVDNRWGGWVFEDMDIADYEQGSNNFIEDLWDMVDFEGRCWWITRINKHLPFCRDNIRMAPLPDKTLFTRTELLVRYGDAVMTVRKAAQLVGVSEEKAFELRAQYGHGQEFMDALIEESIK